MSCRSRSPVIDALIDDVGIVAASARLHVAGVLFTYRCSIRCRHCLFGCREDLPDTVMASRQLADVLEMLHETGRVVHVAGGEAMVYWETLAEGIRLAAAEGNAPHFIETNCSFATDDRVVERRLAFLQEHGVRGVLASADPYHQEWVPPERFLRVRDWTRRIFGEDNFYGNGADAADIEALTMVTQAEGRLRAHVGTHPPVMVGTSRRELSQYLDDFAPDDPDLPMAGWRRTLDLPACLEQFRADAIWEIHVDPYGNVQTNCGIILGKTDTIRPAAVLAAGPEHANRFVECLCAAGPLGLAKLARDEYGFEFPEFVTQGCELCFLARRHLRKTHPDIFGPAEVYE
ncbi:MAG: radical SAM protein [Lentisphaerae bacterium]|jgi:hypothetical protein|nr:radical SAM protein [Lentisphaerota bacterium]MBT4817193.1 radical SAM protein [Lentisphaerota bacterium]MBT5609393.1 radical SAM protein [Lentisphaerota bacterium]MBT7057803.1 radical SAM protein [Lentisphaerota bacterium]MBT7843480.1 radical SAM protein [Lentisphaerota bacterium]